MAQRPRRDAAPGSRARSQPGLTRSPSGGFYAGFGLDGDKQPIDSMTSNMGHLLSERNRPRRPGRTGRATARCLPRCSPDGAFAPCPPPTSAHNPIGYHVGTIWPHDDSIISPPDSARSVTATGQPDRDGDCSRPRATLDTGCRRRLRLRRVLGRQPMPYRRPAIPRPRASEHSLLLLRHDARPPTGARADSRRRPRPRRVGQIRLHHVPALGRRWNRRRCAILGVHASRPRTAMLPDVLPTAPVSGALFVRSRDDARRPVRRGLTGYGGSD